MRIALVGCMVMCREISYLISKSPQIVRPWWLKQGLHNTPDILHAELQRLIGEIELENQKLPPHQRFDTIVFAYGLCSNSLIGLKSQSLPIVVPRCDDCIALLLGSVQRYRQYFQELSGTFWYSSGWIEHGDPPSRERYARERAEYAEKFGEDNADYLMQCSNHWLTSYRHCGYIPCPMGDFPEHLAYARQASRDFGWSYEEIPGDLSYLSALVNGPWDDGRFLTCPPESRIEAEYSSRKIRSVPCPSPYPGGGSGAEEKIVQKDRKEFQDLSAKND